MFLKLYNPPIGVCLITSSLPFNPNQQNTKFWLNKQKKDVFMSLLHMASFALMPNTNLSLQGTTQQTTQ
jgi:hypothetical protein